MTPLLLTLLLTAVSDARPPRPELELRLEDRLIPLQDACFPSGLRVMLQEDHSHPVVAVTAIVEGGFADDPRGKGGTAHLMEHLWYRSTVEGVPVGARLEAVGATWNAWTTRDTTTFRVVAPPDALAALVSLEAQRLLSPTGGLDDAIVAVERGVLRSEARLGYRPIEDLVRARLDARLYGPDDPGAQVAEAGLDAVDISTLRDWSREHYTPRRTTLVIVGDLSLDALWQAVVGGGIPVALLEDPAHPDATTGACPARIAAVTPPPAPDKTPLEPISAAVAHPSLYVGWSIPNVWGTDQVHFALAASLLAYETTARLDDAAVDCGVDPGVHSSKVLCRIDGRSLAVVERAKRNLVAAAGDFALTEEMFGSYLTSVWEQHRAVVFEQMDDVGRMSGGRDLSTGAHLHRSGSAVWIRDEMSAFDKMTPAGLLDAFRTWLNPKRMVTQLVTPVDAALLEFSAEQGEAALLTAAPASRPDPGPADVAALRRLLTLPDLSGVREETLANGLRVVVVPQDAGPRVRVSLVLPGGVYSEPIRGLDALTWEITDRFYSQGTYVSAWVPPKVFGHWDTRGLARGDALGVTASAGNLDVPFFLLRDMVDHAAVDPTERRTRVATWRTDLADRDRSVLAEAKIVETLIPGGGPWSRLGEAELDVLAKLPMSTLRDWSASILQPEGATLLVVGRVDPEQALALARSWLGDWNRAASPRPSRREIATASPSPAVWVQPREALAGTGIDLMCTVSGGELPARVLADAIVDRLERQLRDEAGVSYGVAASVVGDGTSRLLSVSTVVADAAVGDAVVAFQSAVDQLAATSPDVRRYRLMVAREIGGGWRGMDSVARRLEEAFLEGRSIADVSTLPEELAAVDGAAVQRLAASCAANRQVFVVGSSAALATIEAKGIAVGAAPE